MPCKNCCFSVCFTERKKVSVFLSRLSEHCLWWTFVVIHELNLYRSHVNVSRRTSSMCCLWSGSDCQWWTSASFRPSQLHLVSLCSMTYIRPVDIESRWRKFMEANCGGWVSLQWITTWSDNRDLMFRDSSDLCWVTHTTQCHSSEIKSCSLTKMDNDRSVYLPGTSWIRWT